MWRIALDHELELVEDALSQTHMVWVGASFPQIRIVIYRGEGFGEPHGVKAEVHSKVLREDEWEECDLPRALISEMTRLLELAEGRL